MKRNHTFKGFSLIPYLIIDANGVIVDKQEVLDKLADDIKNMQALVQWEIDNNGSQILEQLNTVKEYSANVAGRKLGIKIPAMLKTDISPTGKGYSRYENLFRGELIGTCRSWKSRVDVVKGESTTYVSAGYKRTARTTKPTAGYHMNLGHVDKQYAYYDDAHNLHMLIGGEWYTIIFSYPKRYDREKITLPRINYNPTTGKVSFFFSEATPYQQGDISTRYIVGVDVGKKQYATIVVYDIVEGRIVYESTLSRRVHSLWNSIQATTIQIANLHAKPVTVDVTREIIVQRSANNGKKRELAIIAGQKIAAVAHEWDNAIIAVEDLSWITNTMANGRWNRGELVRQIRYYAEQNGSRVMAVNAAGTSQKCHKCQTKITHEKRNIKCDDCDLVMDRDVNAAANIAQRAIPSVIKMEDTRKKAKSYTPGKTVQKSPKTHPTLKYPGRDRTKTRPTPKRLSKTKKKRLQDFLSSTVEGVISAFSRPRYSYPIVERDASYREQQDPGKATQFNAISALNAISKE